MKTCIALILILSISGCSQQNAQLESDQRESNTPLTTDTQTTSTVSYKTSFIQTDRGLLLPLWIPVATAGEREIFECPSDGLLFEAVIADNVAIVPKELAVDTEPPDTAMCSDPFHVYMNTIFTSIESDSYTLECVSKSDIYGIYIWEYYIPPGTKRLDLRYRPRYSRHYENNSEETLGDAIDVSAELIWTIK